MDKHIIYEMPLTEKIRTFLRIEFIYKQLIFYIERGSDWDSLAAVRNLIELQNVLLRGDLKSDMINEIDRIQTTLQRVKNAPGVDSDTLLATLNELSQNAHELRGYDFNIIHNLSKSVFISTIKQRLSIPGGTCTFDIPSLNYWFNLPKSKRNIYLRKLLEKYTPITETAILILNIIRDSSSKEPELSSNGFFQMQLASNKNYQLIRVFMPNNSTDIPVIIGGRHRFCIHFMTIDNINEKPKQSSKSNRFDIACCYI